MKIKPLRTEDSYHSWHADFYHKKGFDDALGGRKYLAPGSDVRYCQNYRDGYDAGVEKAKLNKLRELVLGYDTTKL